ncbi:MAG: choice-of-anchor L domain-containing protein, partial [Bacteroidota bacterium]
MDISNGPPFTPQSLIETVLLGDGVEVISVDYDGNPASVALFQNGGNLIGMDRGIVMSTGVTETGGGLIGVDNNGSEFADNDLPNSINTDPDLAMLTPNVLQDVTSYTISFRPFGDTLRFRYAFASEEYPEYVCNTFNDVFGFFISGPGINGPFTNNAENIALIPGTTLPVQINNVNPGVVGDAGGDIDNCTPPDGSLAFSQFYIDNNLSNTHPVYDGFTTVFTAEAVVIPCEIYTIRLVIADVGDGAFDSGVFLEARSFSGNNVDLAFGELSIDGTMAEGCRAAVLNFTNSTPVPQDRPLAVTFLGDATPGVDYTMPPSSIVIPAGDSVVSVVLEAFEDNID